MITSASISSKEFLKLLPFTWCLALSFLEIAAVYKEFQIGGGFQAKFITDSGWVIFFSGLWRRSMIRLWVVVTWLVLWAAAAVHPGEQPLSRIAVERMVLAVNESAHVRASPLVLGLKVSSISHLLPWESAVLQSSDTVIVCWVGCEFLMLQGETNEWVEVEFFNPNPSNTDWVGVFSPADFR